MKIYKWNPDTYFVPVILHEWTIIKIGILDRKTTNVHTICVVTYTLSSLFEFWSIFTKYCNHSGFPPITYNTRCSVYKVYMYSHFYEKIILMKPTIWRCNQKANVWIITYKFNYTTWIHSIVVNIFAKFLEKELYFFLIYKFFLTSYMGKVKDQLDVTNVSAM